MYMELKNDFITCRFDAQTGQLRQMCHGGLTLPFSGLEFDLGCDGEMENGLLEYDSMLEARTWVLPEIRPTGKAFSLPSEPCCPGPAELEVRYRLPKMDVTVEYRLHRRYLQAELTLRNTTGAPLYLNTCAFLLRLSRTDGVFDFPGNVPIGRYPVAELKELEPVQTGLINFATHTALPEGHLDLLFLDGIEKWGCGVYRQGAETVYVYDAGLEMDLAPGAACRVGTLYLVPCAPGEAEGTDDPYLRIRQVVAELGYAPAEDGIHDGVMYSCHPAGTMDAGFPRKEDLFQFAERLPQLKEMGVDHVWLLPVFDHNERGVYHSNDQSVIHARYGGEAGCKYYCDRAHALGMNVMFDYVPHGPVPEHPIVQDHPDWPSKRRDGSLQNEWDCVSMDYNHPGYQEYTSALVYDHVRRFRINGARIDCAMGGLSNWRPYGDGRPSGNSVLAGVHITEAIREGFRRGGAPALILPENFNPLPNYYHCTDVFYGMNLYRAFVELQGLLSTDPAEYVRRLTDFLEREAAVTPENYHKLRFLGNHDTVSWVWQSARAVDCYGTEPAKMLFALICLIDGVPMLYQGDEDPTLYGGRGENLTAYFTALLTHRKSCLPKGNRTVYLHTGTPVMAFLREPQEVPPSPYENHGSGRVLVMINLSKAPVPAPAEAAGTRLLAQSGPEPLPPDAPVPPYSYRITQLPERA